MKRLRCLLFGHIPNYVLASGYSHIVDGYFTPCDRCGRIYEERVR